MPVLFAAQKQGEKKDALLTLANAVRALLKEIPLAHGNFGPESKAQCPPLQPFGV